MARAINPMVPRPYILEHERKLDLNQQTTWWNFPLSTSVHARVSDGLVSQLNAGSDESEMRFKTGQRTVEILMYTLDHVDNYLDDEGREKQVPPVVDRKKMTEREKVEKMQFLDTMEPAWRDEIAIAVLNWAKMSETDAKNSDAPSLSGSVSQDENAVAVPTNGLAASA